MPSVIHLPVDLLGLWHGTASGPTPPLHPRAGELLAMLCQERPPGPSVVQSMMGYPRRSCRSAPKHSQEPALMDQPSQLWRLSSQWSLTIEDSLSGPPRASSTLLRHFHLLKILQESCLMFSSTACLLPPVVTWPSHWVFAEVAYTQTHPSPACT